ncbi:hypothetical protein EW146_g620 [Bondarzewia mesenterica]|uniref:Uncharacterized protein n=1 Tax=Bondarzewia mesenterica TaxID=1095465 RepID=A0A4S4M875_9AGAM|nr:hypothetical protein EW146_g620 [Bondarzewia mesenterica]
MVYPVGSQLTVSKINRLLRPLRNKCTHLASLASSSSSSKPTLVTYASRAATVRVDDDAPPLANLLPPKVLLSRAHLDHHSLANLDLSGRIYAVVDAFKNVIKASFDSEREGREITIMTLTDLCAAVVGESIQDEVEQNLYHEEHEERDVDEDAEMAIVDECYESIPDRFRRWTLVSHALSIILDSCPHHATLISSLLDITLSYNLARQSRILLRSLLATAVCPARVHLATPICHPAHSSFLKDLCAKWTTMSLPMKDQSSDSASPSFYTESAFTRILVDVLVEVGSPDAWTSRAVSRFARHLQSNDFPSFVQLLSGLAEIMGRQNRRWIDRHRRGRRVDSDAEDDDIQLCDRFSRWTRVLYGRVAVDSETNPPLPSISCEYQCIIDFLVLSQSYGAHLGSESAHLDSPYQEVQTVLTCLATRCVTSPLFTSCSRQEMASLLNLLSDVKPATLTYEDLIVQSFQVEQPGSSPVKPASPSLRDSVRSLQAYASVLHRRGLRALEASFWICALRHFERDVSLSSTAGGREIGQVRKELIDATGVAEQRLYGSRSSRLATSTASDEDDADDRQGNESDWEWEDMVGCWVRKTPLTKKRKLNPPNSGTSVRTRSSTKLQSLRASDSATSISAPSRSHHSAPSRGPARSYSKPASTSTSSSASTSRTSPTTLRSVSPDTEPLSDDADTDDCDDLDEILTPKKRQRVWNFRTIVADAQKNVINLKEEKAAKRAAAAAAARAAQSHSPIRGRRAIEDLMENVPEDIIDISSDDALDFLA